MIAQNFLIQEWLGNSVEDYLWAVGIFLGLTALVFLLRLFGLKNLIRLTQKSKTDLDDIIVTRLEQNIFPCLYAGALYFAIQYIVLPTALENVLYQIIKIFIVIQGVRFALAISMVVLEKTLLKSESASGTAYKSIFTIIRVVVWGLAIVFLLDNMGFDVNSVIAGLGVGGIAVALAAQTILGDLFNYFVIFFDKPFKRGDFIIIDDFLGSIEHIGIKTTRLRSLGGEQLVFPNSDLTSGRVRNYKRMGERRLVFGLGVVYQTTLEQMKSIPKIIEQIICSEKDTRFDRCHFKGFGDFSLNIEVVFYVLSPDYNKYMDIQQSINFRIMEAFEQQNIEFAYPTQTLYMPKG